MTSRLPKFSCILHKSGCNYKIKMESISLINIEGLKSKFRSKADLNTVMTEQRKGYMPIYNLNSTFQHTIISLSPIRFMKDILRGKKKIGMINTYNDLVIPWSSIIQHQMAQIQRIHSESNVFKTKRCPWYCRMYSRFTREWASRRKVLASSNFDLVPKPQY